MPKKSEHEDTLPPSMPKAGAEPLKECEAPEMVDADEYQESIEDLAVARQAVEEYEAKGIEGTIPYGRYRSKWLGAES